jgi:hypothetical protein
MKTLIVVLVIVARVAGRRGAAVPSTLTVEPAFSLFCVA